MSKGYYLKLSLAFILLISSGFSINGYAESDQELYDTGKLAYVKDNYIEAIKYLFSFVQLQGEEAELAVLNEVKSALDFSEKQLKEAQAVKLAVERGEYDETTINQTAMFSCHCPESGKTIQPNFKKLNPKLLYIPRKFKKPILTRAKPIQGTVIRTRPPRRNTQGKNIPRANNSSYSDEYKELRKKTNLLARENQQLKGIVNTLQKENNSLKRRIRM